MIQKPTIRGLALLTTALLCQPISATEKSGENAGHPTEKYEQQRETAAKLFAKRRLSAEEISKKKEGFDFTAVIGPFSNPDVGIGVVGVTGLFFNGKTEEPLFSYRPYNHRIIIGAFASTKGLIGAGINLDMPYWLGSLFRIRSMSEATRNINENYFGIGEKTLDTNQTLYHFSTGTHSFVNDHENALRQTDINGTSYAKYDKFLLERFAQTTTVERDFAGGIFRVQSGFQIAKYGVTDYTGRRIEVSDGPSQVISGDTRLREDFLQGLISGYQGGFSNALILGLAIDTRDYEPNPKKGVFVDFTSGFFLKSLGSSYEFQKIALTQRYYFSPFNRIPMVLATRLLTVAHFGDTPFYEMHRALTADRQLNGVFGGRLSGRGFRQNRFVAPVIITATFELRTTITSFRLLGQNFELMIAPFLDVGTVYNDFSSVIRNRTLLRTGYGAGVRLAWNQSTIILADYGFSSEDRGFYFYVEHTY